AVAGVLGFRSVLSVPMLHEGNPIGAITVWRAVVGPFSDQHIALLRTFAAQAVIAIENVRLYQALEERTRELARSVEQLEALGAVGQAVSSTLDLYTVLTTIVSRAYHLSGADGGVLYEHDEASAEFRLRATQRLADDVVQELRAAPFHLGEGAI